MAKTRQLATDSARPNLITLSAVGIVASHTPDRPLADANPTAIPFSVLWIALAVVIGGIFVAVLGPGLRFIH